MVKAVQVLEPGRVQHIERDPTPLQDGAVRVRIEAVGICGSDVALMAGKHPYAVYPVVPGHELGGTVIDAGPGTDFAPDQRVAIRPTLSCGHCTACQAGRTNHCPDVRVLGVHLDGGMADEIVLPENLLFSVSGIMNSELAAMVEPTAVAVHLCHRAGIEAGNSVAIIGAGVIGMLAMQIARAWDAGTILAVDRLPQRLEIARKLGADIVVDNRREDTQKAAQKVCPDGFDVVLELVGREETLSDAVEMVRRGGTITMVALAHHPVTFNFEPVYRKEITLQSTRLYVDSDIEEAISLLASGQVDPGPLITHRLPLSQAAEAMALLTDHPEQAIKVLLISS
jgi:2-desacetyl-2-hydroxyethyl bacteriochlorophyllide A dehydrogenase